MCSSAYLFEKAKYLLDKKTYHVIYYSDVLVVFKFKKISPEMKDWLSQFQQIVYNSEGNQHLQIIT